MSVFMIYNSNYYSNNSIIIVTINVRQRKLDLLICVSKQKWPPATHLIDVFSRPARYFISILRSKETDTKD